MNLFVRTTLIVALGIVALVALLFLVKVLFVAGLIAAVAVGGILLYRAIRGRSTPPAIYRR